MSPLRVREFVEIGGSGEHVERVDVGTWGSNDPSRTPTSTYRGSRNLITLKVLVVVGLWFGLVLMLASYRGMHVTFDPVVSEWVGGLLLLGVLGGLAVGLAIWQAIAPMQEPAWLGFVVTARWLAFRGKLPWQIMGFLDDAHRLGLLRTVGSVYQFRHAELQDHLANPGRPQHQHNPND